MHNRARSFAALATLGACAAVAVGGCGSSSRSGGDGELRGTIAAFPDYLDPALSISQEGWSAMWNTYVPLLTYVHAGGDEGTKLIPGLARALPRVSEDGRVYTLFLRRGLRYSDGEPVRASDFRHSVERLISLNSGASPYYASIVGAERFAATGRGGIAGIETDDRSGRIRIRLTEPRGTFPYELATLSGAPLPADTPEEDLTPHPPPATGPYEIVSSRPGRSWAYRRNPEWAANNAELLPQLPDGNFDRIEIDVVKNPATQVAQVEQDAFDWMVNPPPSDRLANLKQRFDGTQLVSTPLVGVFYFWMNTTEPPFDDVRVRRAVNYAISPAALRRIYAGQLLPLQQVLPALLPGHRTFRLYPHDIARARAMIAAADPSERRVTVWTNSFPANLEAGEYYEGVLRELGLEPTLKAIGAANYFSVIGNASTPDLDTGWGNWLLEYPHPNSYFEPQLTGVGLRETGATNWARFVDPALEARIERLRGEPLGPRQEAAYARLDRAVMRQAPWAPFGTLAVATFVASRIDLDDLVISPIYGQDLASFSLR